MECQHFETYIRACPRQVWEALTDPAVTSRYYLGLTVRSAWQPGTAITYRGACPGVIGGQVLVCDPDAGLLVHSITDSGCPAGDPQAWVSWTIDTHQGVCRVRLDASSLDRPSACDDGGGWAFVLAGLKTFLETGSPLWTRSALASDD